MISKPPIKRFVQEIFHPNNEERMIEGANTLIPVDNPRFNKKSKEVRVLVFTSNLVSRYSYAV